jgi:uncharacterized protein
MPKQASAQRERHRRIAEEGEILRALVGSTVHGLVRAGTDDRDEMAVCIEPPEYVIGLQRFEHYVFRTQPEGHPSGPGDLDLVVYSLRKYARLALKGSPTVLLLLFAPDNAVLSRTGLGRRLQELAPAFIARRTGRAFIGYLDAQRRGLVGDRYAPSRAREASEEHGYDTKYAMHALRIGYQGKELLETGRITLPVPQPIRARLMDVRMGSVPLADVLEELDSVVADLEVLVDSSPLQPEPDVLAVDQFLIEAYNEAWSAPRVN